MKTYHVTLLIEDKLEDHVVSAISLKEAKLKASYARRRRGKGKVCNVFLVRP